MSCVAELDIVLLGNYVLPFAAAEVGRMIDATSYYELEAEEYNRKGVQLTPDLWLVKLMVGAIDQSFDEQD